MDYFRHQKYKNKQLTNNFRSINISINEMDKFEKKNTKTFTKNTCYDWYDWLIKSIPEPIKRT